LHELTQSIDQRYFNVTGNRVLLFRAGVVVVVEGTGRIDENGEPVVER
jgi:hypothetical protein